MLNRQLQEIETALDELKGAEGKVFLSRGMLIVEKDKKEAEEELKDRKQTIESGLERMKKKEKDLEGKLKEMQKNLKAEQG